MIRMRWGVAGLALLGVIAGAMLFFLPSGPKQIEDFGPGLDDAPHLAATAALLAALPTPAGTTEDPYDTACRTPVALCFGSTLPTTTLLAEAKTLLTAAGAKLLAQDCDRSQDQAVVPCSALYDVNGAHLAVIAGAAGIPTPTGATFLGLQDRQPTQPSAARPVLSAKQALGTWAMANPFPLGWRLSGSCIKQTAFGCLDFRHLRAAGSPISTSLEVAAADARSSLTAAGFRIDDDTCYPATAKSLGHCTVAGSRFRNLGGTDPIIAVVSVRAEDAGHVTVLADLSAGLT